MSKSITQDMRYRQSLMQYAAKYGVSRASRKYKKSRSYIYYWKARWDGSVASLACQSRRPHHHPNQHTAAEVIVERADHTKDHMGLTSWRNAPEGKIVKADVSVAKNYLSKGEMQELNEIVTMYLDYAARQARRHIPMTMAANDDGRLGGQAGRLFTVQRCRGAARQGQSDRRHRQSFCRK